MWIVFVVSCLLACGRGRPPSSPTAKLCGVDRPTRVPLVVEWPSVERASLESRARKGPVVVRYEGCEVEVLDQCQADGAYAYTALTPKREHVSIRSREELYARLPVGAARLEAALQDSDGLVVDMTVAGHARLDRGVISRGELVGACEGATHVVGGLAMGAFTLSATSAQEREAGARGARAGIGGSRRRGFDVLARDGDRDRCSAIHPVG